MWKPGNGKVKIQEKKAEDENRINNKELKKMNEKKFK